MTIKNNLNSPTYSVVLVGIQLPGVTSEEHEGSLQELSRLVTTLGYRVVGKISQHRSTTKASAILGEGKLKTLAKWTGGPGAPPAKSFQPKSKAAEKRLEAEKTEDDLDLDSNDENQEEHFNEDELPDDLSNDSKESDEPKELAEGVIFDCDLTPSQLRLLESATGVTVLDRTGVIIEIFSRHARTRAAKLQVEIAKLAYIAPRLRETGGEDRQGGGLGSKGAGETTLELDRRKNRDRIKELKTELESVGRELDLRRSRREQENAVALVGYTNAGKSSLMRALTGSDVLVEDKLFATLDTTVRPLFPPAVPNILLSDTVGFIKKLPHDLVASFKSTLDEALNASLLLFVVDASDPTFRSQLEVTKSVLSEVGADELPSLLLLNKKDRLSEEQIVLLQKEYPDAVLLSSRSQEDLTSLRERLLRFFESTMVDETLLVPYNTDGVIGEIRSQFRVIAETYDQSGVVYHLRGKSADFARLKKRYPVTPVEIKNNE